MELYVYSAAVSVAACVLLMALAFRAGMSRMSGDGVKVLETYTTKNEKFIIANRIHLNTLENVVVFLPLLWIATLYGSPVIAASIGGVWLFARITFAIMYTKDPSKRAPAFITSFFCHVALVLLSVYGLVMMFV